MGFMFFPDMEIAAEEMHRMLKYSGRLSTSVWGPPQDNPWISVIMSVVQEHLDIAPPLPGAPGLFRCADPDLMENILQKGSFRNIEKATVKQTFDFQSFDNYWNFITDVAAPVVDALRNVDDKKRQSIREDVEQRLYKSSSSPGYQLPYMAYVFHADR